MLNRRRFLTVFGTTRAIIAMGPALAQVNPPKIVVNKDPTCDCCTGWVDHLWASGFTVGVFETSEINRTKVRLGVPDDLASCHTAESGGYVIERLLIEKAAGKGLAVGGRPMGSSGMEMRGMAPDTYEVALFGPSGQKTFAGYQGARLL